MNWYYESGGQQQGPIPDSELDRLLAEGKITLDTLVWREGLPGWAPIRTARPSQPGAGAASSGGAPIPPTPDAPPPGYIRCTLTGKYFPPSEIIYIEGKPYSAEAKPQVMQSLQSGAALPTAFGPEGTEPAWERRDTLGMVVAARDTIKAVLMKPAEVFSRMKHEGGLAAPLIYNLILGSIGGVVTLIFQLVLNVGTMAFGSGQNTQQGLAAAGVGVVVAVIAYAIMIPVFVTIGAFMGSGLLHLSLMVLKCANRPFETTFRVQNYCTGSAAVFQLVPICGAWVAGIWGLVCLCIGISKAHNIPTGKAVLAVFLPFIVCCVVGGVIAGIIGAFAAVASSQH